MQSIQYVEEVLSRRPLAFRILVWKVGEKVRILRELRIEISNGELVVLRNFNLVDLLLLEQLLLACEDLLEKVLIDDRFIRQIELYCNGVR